MTENNVYVCVKLTSGENLLAMLVSEDETYVELMYPMSIKSIPIMINNRTLERLVSSPFCQFTDDKIFTLPKTSIMFIKMLSDTFASHYSNLVDEYEVPLHLEDAPEEQEKPEEQPKTFVEGNDTVH